MPAYTRTRPGFRALLVDYRADDYDTNAIRDRLEDHYRKLVRKRDGWVEPPDDQLWIDDLSEDDIPFRVVNKIRRRVKRYQERRKNLTGVDHLKNEDRDALKSVQKGVSASYIDDTGADALAAELHDRYPWMSAATEHAWHQLRRSARAGTPAAVGPLLLDGPPGIGKSAWSRSLAAFLRAPHGLIAAAASNAGFAVSGTERGWSTAQAGRPVQLIIQHGHAGPVVVVDEIDKSGVAHSSSGTRMSISHTLLGLLEPVSASRWDCPYFRVPWDLSAVSWILTSNSLNLVPEPLRTRCTIVQCQGLTLGHMRLVADRLANEAELSDPARDAALEAVERLHGTLQRPIDLRDVRRVIDRAQALETRPVLH